MKPVAYVINLSRRKDRWAECQRHWSPYFNLVRVEAEDRPENGELGCKISHHKAAFSAQLPSCPARIVIEDDAVPTEDFLKYGMACIEEAMRNVEAWDYVNCGAFLDLAPIGMPTTTLTPTISPMFLHANYSHNTHFILYNWRSLALLRASLESSLPVDMFLGRNAKDQWVPRWLLSKQATGKSDIREPFENQHKLYDLTEELLKEHQTSCNSSDVN